MHVTVVPVKSFREFTAVDGFGDAAPPPPDALGAAEAFDGGPGTPPDARGARSRALGADALGASEALGAAEAFGGGPGTPPDARGTRPRGFGADACGTSEAFGPFGGLGSFGGGPGIPPDARGARSRFTTWFSCRVLTLVGVAMAKQNSAVAIVAVVSFMVSSKHACIIC